MFDCGPTEAEDQTVEAETDLKSDLIELLIISQEAKPFQSQEVLKMTTDYELSSQEFVEFDTDDAFNSNRGWNGKCSFTLKGRNFIVGSCTKPHHNKYWEVVEHDVVLRREAELSMSFAVCSTFSEDRAMVCNPWWVSDSAQYNGCVVFNGESWTRISPTNHNHGLSGSLVPTKEKARTSNSWTAIYGNIQYN